MMVLLYISMARVSWVLFGCSCLTLWSMYGLTRMTVTFINHLLPVLSIPQLLLMTVECIERAAFSDILMNLIPTICMNIACVVCNAYSELL